MAIPTQVVVDEVDGPSIKHEYRRHLQRLIRKVQHVLVVKHWIDDLRGIRRHRQENIPNKTYALNDLSVNLPILPEINGDLKTAGKYLVGRPSNSALPLNSLNAKSTLKHLLGAPVSNGGLHALESFLDVYIVHSYDWVVRCQQRIGNTARSWKDWNKKSAYIATRISWAKKRSSSIKDNRSLALLVKLLGPAEQFHILQGYLDAYFTGSYGNARETLSEVVSRLRAVFGVGWFFEWPSGRHPLNSTWPWADVKPSLLVLWGVCWMFFPDYGNRHNGRQQIHNTYYTVQNQRISTQQQTPISFHANRQGLLPTSQNPQNPVQLMPSRDISRQTQPIMQGFSPFTYGKNLPEIFTALSTTGDSLMTRGPNHPATIQSPREDSHLYLRNDNPERNDGEAPNDEARNLSADWRHSVDPALGEHQNFPPQATITIHHHCQRQQLTPTIGNISYPQSASSVYSIPMPPSSTFNYPPLDNMGELQDSRAYIEQDRVYNPMPLPDPHEYDHGDHQQEQPRYPSPPPPLSENPYNAQQPTETPDSRIDIPIEPKSESDALSPGRSKPVPKPDREVTKDTNGRFYCNWPNCTEEQRDFGRKCEWSKHMDKHDRPYKCPAEGCEKLPGFTYSGGLLRHEREVHNKHGGPRKQLNCPHLNCKRHTGKGFSRQENLNEHLRRVHTDAGPVPNGEETEEDGVETLAGGKRKRARTDSQDLREEMKRLRQENEELRRQAEAQNIQSTEMMRQILQLQASMRHPSMQAPPAQMT